MNAGWYWARASRRRTARGIGLLVLLVALGAGGVMAAAAGARRTATGPDRLMAVSDTPEAFAFAADEATLARIATDRPEVARSFGVIQLGLQPAGVRCDESEDAYFQVLVPRTGEPFSTPKPRLQRGRFADPTAADEAVVSEQHARRLGVDVGDRIDFLAYDIGDDGVDGCLAGIVGSVEVVGVIREWTEIGADEPTLAATYLTPAFVDANPDAPVVTFAGIFAWIDLEPGASAAAFVDAVNAAAAREAGGGDEGSGSEGAAGESGGDEGAGEDEGPPGGAFLPLARSSLVPAVDALAVSLWALAGVLAAAALLTVVISISRQTAAAAPELRVLSAVGASSRQLVAAAAVRPLLALVVALPLAVVLAVALSAVHLVGVARLVEPDPGLDVDPTVLLVGALGAVLVVAATTAVVAVRAATRASRQPAPPRDARSRAGAALRRVAPPWVAIGTGYAFDRGRRETAVPTRGATGALTAATAGIVAVLVFGLGVGRANEDPSVYGFGDWDAFATTVDEADEGSIDVPAVLSDDPAVKAIAEVSLRFKLELGGVARPGLAVENLRGRTGPTIVAGRLPEGDDEVALGTVTAEDLGVGVGDRLTTSGPAGERELEVVGLAAFPSYDGDAISSGWVAERDALDRLGWGDGCNDDAECFTTYTVSWRDDVDPGGVAPRLRERGVEIEPAAPGQEVTLVSQADQVPGAAAAGVGVIAAIGVAHALAVTVSRRRRELATMAAIGFRRRQVGAVLVAEALALGLAGAVVGAVLGVAAGRLAWDAAARHIGIGPALPSVGGLAIAVAVAVVVLALALSVPAAVRAARSSPADPLRDA